MKAADLKDPYVGNRSALIADALSVLGSEELASWATGRDGDFTIHIACTLGLLTMRWDSGEDPRAAWSLSGTLVPWASVQGARCDLSYTAKDFVPWPITGALVAEHPALQIEIPDPERRDRVHAFGEFARVVLAHAGAHREPPSA